MIRGIVFFGVVWALVSVGIIVFSHLSGREKGSVFKVLSYGAFTALVTSVVVAVFVGLFN